MTSISVTILYDPVRDEWAAENPIKVGPGVTEIRWQIELMETAAGEISFGIEPLFQGITFNRRRAWPGTPPKGNATVWTTTIKDDLKPGDKPKNFHYTVNALYKADTAQPIALRKSWDPDIEEDPDGPPPVHQ